MNPLPEMPERLSAVRSAVDALMSQYCDEQIARAKNMSPSYERLWQTIKDYLHAGGKRLRPYLVVLSYQAYGGSNYDAIIRTAAAWELLHSCLLIHDDIIDRDYIRHGQPNIAGTYNTIYEPLVGRESAKHYSAGAALLAGDLALTAAYSFVMSSDLTSDEKVFAARLLDEAIFNVGGGEFLDMEASVLPYGSIDPVEIAKQKTAHYSFVSPIYTGASLAGVSKEQLLVLEDYAVNVGLGFQLVDDILGLFGDEQTIGKSAKSDLREGKYTAVLDKTMKLANEEQRANLQHIIKSADVTDVNVQTVQKLAVDTGAKQAVELEIADMKQSALAAYERLEVADEYRNEFRWVIAAALERNA